MIKYKMKVVAMKVIVVFMLLCVRVMAQELVIEVTNPAPFDRRIETIEVPWNNIGEVFGQSPIAVFEGEQQRISQTIDINGDGAPELLLFQSSFTKNEVKTFIIRKAPAPEEIQPVTMAKFMTPREDMAWENDRIAFRIYGSALAGDVRSGLDVLAKRVRYHVLEKWYEMNTWEGEKKVSYHVDHGEGADFFSVGKTLGGGGCALWFGEKMHISGLFTSHKLIASGPIRAMFTVAYEKDSINGMPYKEEKTYTLDAGENLNRIDVAYSGLQQEGAVPAAIGLVKRNNTKQYVNENEGWLSLWGLTNDDSTNGFLGTGLVMPAAQSGELKETADHYLMIVKTSPEKTLTYYAGGGWNRSGDFPSVEDWNGYLSHQSQRLKYPLEVSVKK